MRLPDAEARDRIATQLDSTLVVEAAAGTGKTTALVDRLARLLASGRATLDEIVAVTFTDKAAGEMKLRLRSKLETLRAESPDEPTGKRLDEAIARLETAHISTIHAFCAELLRERPLEAGVDPELQLLSDSARSRLVERAFDEWLEAALADPPPALRRALIRLSRGWSRETPRKRLIGALHQLIEHRDFPGAWKRPELDREPEMEEILEDMAVLIQLLDDGPGEDDYLAKNLTNIAAFLEEQRHSESVRGRDFDLLEADLVALLGDRKVGWHWTGSRRRPFGAHDRSEVIVAREAVKDRLEAFAQLADADFVAALHGELLGAVAGYEQLKRTEGALDFLDLLILARDLIRDEAEVRRQLQQRLRVFFVDEVQDTDPLQTEILLLLSADDPESDEPWSCRPRPGSLFLVGDPKQSIYRFRRADIALYDRLKRHVLDAGAELIELGSNFRSRPDLIAAVNATFAQRFRGAGDAVQAGWVALEPTRPASDQPAFIALPIPRPYGKYGKITRWSLEAGQPEAIARWIAWLIGESGWQTGDGDERRGIQAEDICLLFRRFRTYGGSSTKAYTEAFESVAVPHVVLGGVDAGERDEVLAVRNVLAAIEWPDDSLRVYASLRGPFLAIGDEALLLFKKQSPLHPLAARGELGSLDGEQLLVAKALDLLGELHCKRNHRPIAETLGAFFEACRAHAGLALWSGGEHALASLGRILDRGRRWERAQGGSFRSFVEDLEAASEAGRADSGALIEEAGSGVRLMTTHTAKGLEFPVVVLADVTAGAWRAEPSRHIDPERKVWAESLLGAIPLDLRESSALELERDRAESDRLAYVAATRARDLLVLPQVGDHDADEDPADIPSWTSALDHAAFPETTRRRRPIRDPRFSSFGPRSVLERPERVWGNPSDVAPGLHLGRTGTEVLWWDPARSEGTKKPNTGLRATALLTRNDPGAADLSVENHRRWTAQRSTLLERAAQPTMRRQAVTERAAELEELSQPVSDDPAELQSSRPEGPRPGGRRFGSLVHGILETVALDADHAAIVAATDWVARIHGATDEESTAATRAVTAALACPLMQRARAAEEVRREVEVVHRLPDGRLLEGLIDLAFREDDQWLVVDFKTDRDLGPREPVYQRQLALYREAMRAAGLEVARCYLLLV